MGCIFSTLLWEIIYYVLALKIILLSNNHHHNYHHHQRRHSTAITVGITTITTIATCEIFISRLLQAVGSRLRLWRRWQFSLCFYLSWKILLNWPLYTLLTFELGSFRKKNYFSFQITQEPNYKMTHMYSMDLGSLWVHFWSPTKWGLTIRIAF